ncbi:dihydrolipoamide acetyltransferase family protein [Alicyclobacillus dauci]|uniref:Dihydrolipoamide acetyltransferase component of pyruvate dehydrogenase complex n=1 Tax=Alicyclobacillus dauci TaxID=1475485 RepID=A0ABY6YXN3_9BACL|nr:dihydrolipoamide acetyltransferase family protein [Alicyclobacillus dauci]WAH35169.1 2-oxo acid dehydrogenase subunit E2 [Alicyclobacillus dauci]
MFEFKLPDIGEGMHEGDIQKWLVRVGDEVRADQPIVEVQTDKVTAELPSPVSGVISKILCQEGQTVTVGTTIVVIDEASEAEVSAAATTMVDKPQVGVTQTGDGESAQQPYTETVPTPASVGVPKTTRPAQRVIATPHVRSLARRMSIDIEQVTGTGRGGRVTESDLESFADKVQRQQSEQGALPERPVDSEEREEGLRAHMTVERGAREERIPLRGIRKQIAMHMVKSVSTIPHVTHVDEIEMDALHALRDRLKPHAEARNVKLTFLPFFIKALVIALKEFPMLNASLDDAHSEIIQKHYYHIGIATDTDNGLVVPVIKDADKKTMFQLACEVQTLAALAREGKLTLDQITGGTFTITNIGPIGGLYATPIINHPEAAILGLHKMEPRSVVRNGESVIRVMMNISLSFDHRLIDGATAVRFTNRMKGLLEDPDQLFLELT